MNKKMFIVLEGLDGCGKSTQVINLYEWLNKEGYPAVLTAEPTKSELGGVLREILSGDVVVNPETLALLFTADRSEHLGNVILPAICEGNIVISERYYYSTIAYQSAQGVDRDWIIQLNSFARKPDLTIFLDVKPKAAAERSEGIEIFENEKFLRKVYKNYMKFDDIVKINGKGDKDAIFDKIKGIVSDALDKVKHIH